MTIEEEHAKRIHDMEIWAAEHDGRINAKWSQQDSVNTRTEAALKVHNTRISELEMRVIKWAAAAAAAGSIGGSSIPKFIGLIAGM